MIRYNLLPHLALIFFSGSLMLYGCTGAGKVKAPSSSPGIGGDKAYTEALKNSRSYEGLFTVYQDTLTGETHFEIEEEQLDREYIYFSQTADGIVSAGHFRGRYAGNKVVNIRKYYDRIEFVTQNTSFYFDEESPLSKASKANISPSVMVSQEIVAHKEDEGVYLISSDDIFLEESLSQIKPSALPGAKPGAFTLGNLSSDRTRYLDIRSYPENTDVLVEYVYENPSPVAGGGRAVTDARYISIKFQHTFLEMPDNDYEPRFEDARVGYFTQQVDDMTSTSPTPYRDLIHRWNLQKKNPGAERSEPKEPIVWWIENTTPEEFRQPIADGVLAWNEAFEQAGFKNAVQVKVQPDSAEWDANDIRYNVLRWTSSPRPPFAGYGPSFVNPRTGEILGANVMLEFIFFRRHLLNTELFGTAALDFHENDSDHNHKDGTLCNFGFGMQQNLMTGLSVARGAGLEQAEEDRMVNEALKMLALHEVGHTLGLTHNMKASYLHSPESVYDREETKEDGLTGSVMDYGVVNLSPDPEIESQYFDVKPGIYDNWAIEFGYSPAAENPKDEEERLDDILSRSNEWGHHLGNDADDMRSPGKAIDPRVMTYDMSSDPITYSSERIELLQKTTDSIMDRYIKDDESYHELRNIYLVLSGQHGRMAGVITRYIGGIYVDRSLPGQETDTKPFTPVSKKDQQRALQALNKYVFAPDAFDQPAELYNYLQMQRRGFGFYGLTEDPKIHDRALNIQKKSLDHILHPVVLKRMTDTQLYGNEYPLAEFMQDLTKGVFETDIKSYVNTFRQNLQIEYVDRLVTIINENSSYDSVSKSLALYNLMEIHDMLDNRPRNDMETIAHSRHLLLNIEKALDAG